MDEESICCDIFKRSVFIDVAASKDDIIQRCSFKAAVPNLTIGKDRAFQVGIAKVDVFQIAADKIKFHVATGKGGLLAVPTTAHQPALMRIQS